MKVNLLLLYVFGLKSMHENFKKLQAQNESKLNEFLEFFELALCKRCWAESYREVCAPYHHHGGLLELINSISLDRSEFTSWLFEPYHGFTHGFVVLFLAYCLCLSEQKDELLGSLFFYNERRALPPRIKSGEVFFMSCIIHDYLKVCGKKDHDSKLFDLIDTLDPVVYTHSNPSEKDQSNPIIGADRIELMRFDDHAEWCDQSVLDPYIEIYGGIDLIAHFYKHIRPVIAKMFASREDVWISHLLEVNWQPIEKIKDNKGVDYYPKSHWRAKDVAYSDNLVDNIDSYFSVNMARLSDTQCLMHGTPNHGPMGLISLGELKSCGCELKSAPRTTCGRDHPFVLENKRIPISKWSFLYTKTSQLDQFDELNFHVLEKSLFERIYRVTESFITKMLALGIK